MRSFLFALATVSLGLLLAEFGHNFAHAVNYTWDPGNTANGATIDPASGTWDTTALNWNNAGVNVAWSGNNTALFGGTDGTYAVTLASPITSSAVLLNFTNSGYTISAAAPQSLTSTFSTSTSAANNLTGMIATKASVWVEPGKTGTLGNNVTFNANGASFGQSIGVGAGATLNIAAGSKIDKAAGANRDLLFAGSGNFNVAGTVTRSVATDTASLIVGQWSGETTVMNVNSGGVVSTASNGTINSGTGSILVGNFAGVTGRLNINAGGAVTASNTAGASTGLKLAQTAGANGEVNLNGGTLSTLKVFQGAGTGTFNFNGGTLIPVATNNSNFMTGLTSVNVQAGGAKIDTNGFDVTIAQTLQDGGGGGLSKLGAGTLTLSSFNTYAGATTVSGGLLSIPSGGGVSAGVVVNSGGSVGGAGTISSGITLNAGGNILADGVAGSYLFSQGLTIAGPSTYSLGGSVVVGNTYTILNIGSGSVTGSLGNFTGTVRSTAPTLSGSDLVTTVLGFGTRTWNTTSGVWNVNGALNFVEGDQKFFDGDTVIFNNPTAPSAVTITGAVAPAAVTINNSTNAYTFSGGGTINGAAATLTKNGAGLATISTANTYGGGTTINGGVLAVASDATLGAATGGVTINAGTLRLQGAGATTRNFKLGAANSTIEVDPTFTYSTSGTLADDAAPGTLNKTGDGALVLSGDTTGHSNGAANVLGGRLSIVGTLGPAASTGTIAISPTATLTVNGGTSTNTITGSGAILSNGATAVFVGDHTGFTGAFTQDSGNNTQFNTDLSASAGASYSHLNGEIVFAGSTGGPADYTVKMGALTTAAGRNVRGANAANSGAGTVTLEVGQLGTDTTIAGGLNNGTGASSKVMALRKVGAGTLTLGGANNYSGGTTVSGGTLLVNGTNSSTTANFTVDAAGTLGGTGTIAGNVLLSAGGGFKTIFDNLGAVDSLAIGGNLDLSALGDTLSVSGAGIGTSWAIINYTGSLTGTFENIPVGYTVDYGTGTNSVITLNSTGPVGLPGDFNSDNKVDAADYTRYRDNVGSATALPNDNGLGTPIGAAHYTLWKNNFGMMASAAAATSSAVPEPAAILLIILGVSLCLSRKLS